MPPRASATTQHVEAVSNDGSVTFCVERDQRVGHAHASELRGDARAAAGPSPSFAAVATLTAGSANNSTTSNDWCGRGCRSYNPTNDAANPPGFNSLYEYEVQSYAGVSLAGPIPPTTPSR